VPDVAITVWVLLMMDEGIIRNMHSCLQKYNKTVYSCILLDSYLHTCPKLLQNQFSTSTPLLHPQGTREQGCLHL